MTRIDPSTVYFDPSLQNRISEQRRVWQPDATHAAEQKAKADKELNEPLVQALIERTQRLRALRFGTPPPILVEDRIAFAPSGFVTPHGQNPIAPAALLAHRATVRRGVREIAQNVPRCLGRLPEEPSRNLSHASSSDIVHERSAEKAPEKAPAPTEEFVATQFAGVYVNNRMGETLDPRVRCAISAADPLDPYEPELLTAVRYQNEALRELMRKESAHLVKQKTAAALLAFFYVDQPYVRTLMEGMRSREKGKRDYFVCVVYKGGSVWLGPSLYLTPKGFAFGYHGPESSISASVPLKMDESLESFCRVVETGLASIATRSAEGQFSILNNETRPSQTPPQRKDLPDQLPKFAIDVGLESQVQAQLDGLHDAKDEAENGPVRLGTYLRAVQKEPRVKFLRQELKARGKAEGSLLALKMGVQDIVLTHRGFATGNYSLRQLPKSVRTYQLTSRAAEAVIRRRIDAIADDMEPYLTECTELQPKRSWWKFWA